MDVLAKKIIRDYIYHLETFKDVKEISSVAEGEFRSAMTGSDSEAIEALSNPDGKIKKEEEPQEMNHGDTKFKKLFRKAAVKCHPDKLLNNLSEKEAQFMKSSYESLTIANDTYDWGLLLKVCLDLDIEVDELGEVEKNNIIENTEILKTSIAKYENSMAYSWYKINDETQKNEYLAECAKIFKKSLKF